MAIVDPLLELGKVDSLIRSANEELAAGPQAVSAAEAEVKKQEELLAAAKTASEEAAKEVHSIEVDISAVEEEIQKTRDYQRQAKSNKEYQIFNEKRETAFFVVVS